MRRQVSPAVVVIVVIVVLLIIIGIWQYVYQRPPVPFTRQGKPRGPREGPGAVKKAPPAAPATTAPGAGAGGEIKQPAPTPEEAAPEPNTGAQPKGQ